MACFLHDGVRLRHLARPEGPVQVRARREHGVARGVVGAHPLLGPDHLRRPGSGRALADASLVTVITQDILVMTHLLFRLCVVVLSLVTSRWLAAAAAGSVRSDAFFHSFPA